MLLERCAPELMLRFQAPASSPEGAASPSREEADAPELFMPGSPHYNLMCGAPHSPLSSLAWTTFT